MARRAIESTSKCKLTLYTDVIVKTRERFGYSRLFLYLCTRQRVIEKAGGSMSGVH